MEHKEQQFWDILRGPSDQSCMNCLYKHGHNTELCWWAPPRAKKPHWHRIRGKCDYKISNLGVPSGTMWEWDNETF